MDRQELDRLCGFVESAIALYDPASPSPTEMRQIFNDAYDALFAPPETDFGAFDDGDPGPSPDVMGPEVEDGIFNFVVHLVKNYSLAMTPEQARERVAAWLEEIAKGLRKFSNTEE